MANLFSVKRPQTSTKLYRRPSRGALGNGLRVVAAAVLATGGRITIRTAGMCLQLQPRPDGTTAVRKRRTRRPLPAGVTRVAVWLGPAVAVGRDAIDWAVLAVEIAAGLKRDEPTDRPSAHWHTPESFFGLLRDAAPGTTVRQVVECFDGLSGAKASVACDNLTGPASVVLRADADALFGRVKAAAAAPSPNALGRVGKLPAWGLPKQTDATFTQSKVNIPARVEAWARPASAFGITVCVNSTPCPAPVSLSVGKTTGQKNMLTVLGVGLRCWFAGNTRRPVAVLVNVPCPAIPLLGDGKVPGLGLISDAV